MPRGLPDLSGRELLREWQQRMESVVASTASLTGHAELPRQMTAAMQHQLELVEEIVERERRIHAEVTARVTAPVTSLFDLLDESGRTLHHQAEALEAAGRALEEAGALMKSQAALFERTVGTLREPVDFARSVAGVDPRQSAHHR